ncbi:hypothetical protein [Oricola indica]|jgi:hypothetical protein|uniref:hypothetical protein n=1 Tax=Oricola indica TaxID=2872591 RepID=UPI001CBD862D|nr:hypothetical protein [Oricola indica]
MKERPHFDYGLFSADVKAGLRGLSYRQCVGVFPFLTINSLSRAINQQPLSPPNMMALCHAFDLDPRSYFTVKKQDVPALVSRETRTLSGILGRLRETRT